MSDTYKPTGTFPFLLFTSLLFHPPPCAPETTNMRAQIEHDGLKEDGTPDKRVGTGQFAQGKVDPTEAGAQGGKASGGSSESTGSSGGSGGGNGRKYFGSPL